MSQPPQGPVTGRDLAREAAEEFLSFDRGLPHTVRELLLRPGATVRRYLDTRDPRLTRPLRLFVIATALASAVLLLLRERLERVGLFEDGPNRRAMTDFLLEHALLLSAIGLPLAALILWLLSLGRERWLHCLVLATYTQAVVSLLNAALTPLLALVGSYAPAALAATSAVAGLAVLAWVVYAWTSWQPGHRGVALARAVAAALALQVTAASAAFAALRLVGLA